MEGQPSAFFHEKSPAFSSYFVPIRTIFINDKETCFVVGTCKNVPNFEHVKFWGVIFDQERQTCYAVIRIEETKETKIVLNNYYDLFHMKDLDICDEEQAGSEFYNWFLEKIYPMLYPNVPIEKEEQKATKENAVSRFLASMITGLSGYAKPGYFYLYYWEDTEEKFFEELKNIGKIDYKTIWHENLPGLAEMVEDFNVQTDCCFGIVIMTEDSADFSWNRVVTIGTTREYFQEFSK